MRILRGVSRRSFVARMTGLAAVAAFPTIVRSQALGLGGATAASERITVGGIGVGLQGTGLLKNLFERPAAQVVAVCDVDRNHRQAARKLVEENYARKTGQGNWRGCGESNDLEELLARPDIDAVVIATPGHWHALATILAAQAGKHSYCEKPLATSIPEGRAMVEAVRRAGVICQIGSQQRSWRCYQHGTNLVRNGYLGQIKRVRVHMPGGFNTTHEVPVGKGPETVPDGFDYDRWLGPFPAFPYRAARCHYNWRYSFETSGGAMEDWVGHNYDSMTVAMGLTAAQPVAIRKASAKFITKHPLYNTADSLEFEAAYSNGLVVECNSRFDQLRIEGSEGWIEMSRGGNRYSNPALERVVIPPHRQVVEPTGKLGAHFEHMENFLACVRSGARPRCPVDEAHNATAVCHLANAAFRAGCKEFRWDPKTETVVDAPDVARFIQRTFRSPWTLPA